MSSLYSINKGVDQAIEFKGFKAQYILWLGGGIVALLFLFALMYLAGVDMMICLVITFGLGTVLFWKVNSFSKQYGEHGMMKKMASRHIPKYIRHL